MSSCVVFSATIISSDRLFVLRRFLETFKSKFPESDVYIGINPVSIPEVESVILEYELPAQMTRADISLYNESDASGYQAAIKLLYDSDKRYDNYWFVHTKSGVNNHSDYLREWYIDNFLSNKAPIESYIKTKNLGSYGMLGLEYDFTRHYTETDADISLWTNGISEDLPYTHSYFFYIHSIYVIAAGPINKFLDLITDVWFTSKLDRYYFEGVFPFIVSRAGYFPYLENGISVSGRELSDYQLNWVIDNKLEDKYMHLINQFKTNYHFKQLQPPYVSSYA